MTGGRSFDSNSSAARSTRFHTAQPSKSPFSSMASARLAASMGASWLRRFTSRLAVRWCEKDGPEFMVYDGETGVYFATAPLPDGSLGYGRH